MAKSRFTEKILQGYVMRWMMYKKQADIVVPNFTTAFGWECDVFAVVKSGLVHEFEIKTSKADYKADFKKFRKHHDLKSVHNKSEKAKHPHSGFVYTPSYFWFVTPSWRLDPPPYAGWLVARPKGGFDIIRPAPRLHNIKVKDSVRKKAARSLSYRIMGLYTDLHPIPSE